MKQKFLLVIPLFALLLFAVYYFNTAKNNSVLAAEIYATKDTITNKLVLSDSLPPLPDSLSKVDTILVAWKSKYRIRLYHHGQAIKTWIIGLGQEPIGHKQKQGDNRTPEGDYRIIQKSKGPFAGDYAHYLGVAWMRINYPNNADAANGFKKGLITEKQRDAIYASNKKGTEPLKTTALGGGIGIHGWYGAWPGNDKQNLTWGCVSVQNTELEDLYKRVNLQTRIVIYP
jgi:murein L,D-transpeptidase YafK